MVVMVKVAENSNFCVHFSSSNRFQVNVNGQISQRQKPAQTAIFAPIFFLVAEKAKEMITEVTFLTKDVFELHSSPLAAISDN